MKTTRKAKAAPAPKLTAQSVADYARHVPEKDRISDEQADRVILLRLLELAPEEVKRQLMAALLADVEAFRRIGDPGHEVWYFYKLQVAARAAEYGIS